jgi:hypothetical protein
MITKTPSKKEIVADWVNDILHKHKNAFADRLENGEPPDLALARTDLQYRKAIQGLQIAYPNHIRLIHFEYFKSSTKQFMDDYIKKRASEGIVAILKATAWLTIISLIALTLWTI